jgi:trans-feruloyl-CoA hydratase/vanillin synthase
MPKSPAAKVSSSRSTAKPTDVVLLDVEDEIAWVTLNRPDKRNAMNPAVNKRMLEILDELEDRDDVKVMVLTGAGDSFSAGMDLKEYFRETEAAGRGATLKARRAAYEWYSRRLVYFEKATIAMVNGWAFGGALTPISACDLSIAANEATFGVSEVNWGILPGGNVTKALAMKLRQSDALYYIMTGETFDGKRAAEMGLVNQSVPRAQLKARVTALAEVLKKKNPHVLKAAKDSYKRARELTWEQAEEYLVAKQAELNHIDKSQGRQQGLKQFLDEKSFRPGLETYKTDV